MNFVSTNRLVFISMKIINGNPMDFSWVSLPWHRNSDLILFKVGSSTNVDQTECFSSHATTFAGSFRFLPQPINWNYVFANADFARNKTIYLTVLVTLIVYIILMIYARYKDKKDLEKFGVVPLVDNRPIDNYLYQIIVFTGQRFNAGTNSKVKNSFRKKKEELLTIVRFRFISFSLARRNKH